MKKITVFLLLSVMAMGASAQGLFWGVKGGFNGSFMTNARFNSNERGMPSIDVDGFKPSFNIGVFAEYQFNKRWAIQPELVYSRQGGFSKVGILSFQNNGDGIAGSYKVWYRVNYLNVPILAKWYALPGKLSIDLGPQFGFALKHDVKTKLNSITAIETIDKDAINTFDFAVAAGVTYYFTPMIGANVRYNLGLTDIAKDNDGDAMRNQVIQVGINFRF